MHKKRLLITGATGFLGFRTLEKLVQDEDIETIIAAGRVLRAEATVESPRITYQLGELQDVTYVKSLFKKPITHIIHCAAFTSPWGSYQEFYQANVMPIKLLLEAAAVNGIHRFVNISTPSIYYNGKDRWRIKESDPLPEKFVNFYAQTKREAEIVLEESGMEFISLRPRALIGRGDTVIMPRLIRAVNEGRFKIIGNGENQVDLTSVANVVKAIRLGLDAPEKALNKHYNISNGEPVKIWKLIGSTLNKLNMELPDKKLPFILVDTIARIMEIYAKMTGKGEPVLTRYSVGTVARNFTMDITMAKELLGFEPEVSVETSVNEFLAWYKELNVEGNY